MLIANRRPRVHRRGESWRSAWHVCKFGRHGLSPAEIAIPLRTTWPQRGGDTPVPCATVANP
eukprot:7467742-Lingulodinium_polyedra.AAC.1